MAGQYENNFVRLVSVLWNVWRTFWWWLFVIVVIYLMNRMLCS